MRFNTQVESLFRNFHTRRTLRIRVLVEGKKTEKAPPTENSKSHEGGMGETESTNNSNSDTEE